LPACVCGDALERADIAHLRVERIRDRAPSELDARVGPSRVIESHDPLRVDDVLRLAQQQLVDDPKHRRVRADAEAERQHDHRGESGTSAEGTQNVARVLPERLEPREPDR
jgi:hypothetical protein